jgi:MFS family permease
VAVSGAPSVEHELGLSHTGYVTLAFVAPVIVAAAIEAVIAAKSDAWDRRKLMVAGQAVLAVALGVLAITRNTWVFTGALALAGAGSGVGCATAQAILVARDPAKVDRTMLRWTLFAAVGDVAAPLITGAAMALGFSYRAAMGVVGVMVAVQCVGLFRVPPAPSEVDDAEAPADPLRLALGRAVRMPRLWAWLFAAATCTLLDELVIALAALRMEREQGTGPTLATSLAVTFSLGAVLGTLLTDRLVARFGSRVVLLTSAVLCACALVGVLAPSALVSAVALFLVGVTCSPHHALSLARAYATMPRNPGTVQAIGQLFVIVDVGAPLVLGLVADGWGLRVALATLLVQPAVILAFALLLVRERRG